MDGQQNQWTNAQAQYLTLLGRVDTKFVPCVDKHAGMKLRRPQAPLFAALYNLTTSFQTECFEAHLSLY